MVLSRLITLSISSPCNFESNELFDRAHQLYDATLLTRCYTQHARPSYIDSEMNHIRYFIKIQFINKGIEFINLHTVYLKINLFSLLFLIILKIRNNLSFF